MDYTDSLSDLNRQVGRYDCLLITPIDEPCAGAESPARFRRSRRRIRAVALRRLCFPEFAEYIELWAGNSRATAQVCSETLVTGRIR